MDGRSNSNRHSSCRCSSSRSRIWIGTDQGAVQLLSRRYRVRRQVPPSEEVLRQRPPRDAQPHGVWPAAQRRDNGDNAFEYAGTCAWSVCLPRKSCRRRRCTPRPVLVFQKINDGGPTTVPILGPQGGTRLGSVCRFSVKGGVKKRNPFLPDFGHPRQKPCGSGSISHRCCMKSTAFFGENTRGQCNVLYSKCVVHSHWGQQNPQK